MCLLAHNSASYIRDAIESVLAQTYTHWECIISDDASTDGTQDIIESLPKDERIRVVHQRENLGQAGNWAYAMSQTTAPYITTLHADDVWFPHTLETFSQAIESCSEVDLIWGRWIRCDQHLNRLAHQPIAKPTSMIEGNEILETILLTNPLLPSASCFRRELSQKISPPSSHYGMMVDIDWFVRLATVSKKALSLDTLLMQYRVHEEAISAEYGRSGKLLLEMDRFQDDLQIQLEPIKNGHTLLNIYKKNIGEFYFRSALSFAKNGDTKNARKRMNQALKLNSAILNRPTFFLRWFLFLGLPLTKPIINLFHGRNNYVVKATHNSVK